MFSISHMLLLVLGVVVLFGAGRLPRIMEDLAKGMKAFKKGMNDEEQSQNSSRKPKQLISTKSPEARTHVVKKATAQSEKTNDTQSHKPKTQSNKPTVAKKMSEKVNTAKTKTKASVKAKTAKKSAHKTKPTSKVKK